MQNTVLSNGTNTNINYTVLLSCVISTQYLGDLLCDPMMNEKKKTECVIPANIQTEKCV